jgi:hypothetical protein
MPVIWAAGEIFLTQTRGFFAFVDTPVAGVKDQPLFVGPYRDLDPDP